MPALRPLLFLILTLATGSASDLQVGPGVTLDLDEAAASSLISRGLFVEGGKWHLRDPTECSYGYLENPKVAITEQRLTLIADLHGREAVRALGKCVGPRATFPVSVSAVPYSDGSHIGLQNITLESTDDRPQVRALLALMRRFLPETYTVSAKEMIQQAFAAAPLTTDLLVRELRVERFVATAGALTVDLQMLLSAS